MKLLIKFPLIFIVILFLFNYACTDIDDDLGLDDIIESYSDITASRIKRRSMNINWLKISDKVREMEHLQYKVVRSLEPNIDTVYNALANGLLEMNWTTNTNTVSITNLEIDTIYYFNVLVKDDIGRTAIYKMKEVRTLDPNTPLPGNDGTMSISNISTNFITISWIEAQDENFTQADLNYRIYYSTANNIDTLENIKLKGTPVANFSNNVTSLSATGLTEGTIYYFNVIVSNNNGYTAPYNTISERTADSNPPVPGNSGNFMLMKVLSNSMDVVWTKASDTYTDETNIEYKVVYSPSDNVSTVADAESNGTIITDWTKDIDTASASGLGILTTYYFNVIVKDHWGNKAVYTSDWRITPEANGNYLYNHGFTGATSAFTA
ncbi:MAG: fibronectin type III domain-containing protein [Spirochaetes bacterium]|nr:fibronectin type III domain-containing protein [Spirochaetota bacterium]